MDESRFFGVCISLDISSSGHGDLRGMRRFGPAVVIVGHPFQVIVGVILKTVLEAYVVPRHLPITVEVDDGCRGLDPEGEHRVHLC